MDIDEILIRHKYHNGMKIIDFSEVALPIYRVTATALLQEKVGLATIDEFVLRSILLGFRDITSIYKLLGISEKITRSSLSSLIQANLIVEADGGKVSLTKIGKQSAGKYSSIRPTENQITFDHDGLVRKVKLANNDIYLSPKEVKDQGLIEIRSIPARRPKIEEIDLQEVSLSLSRYTSIGNSSKTLLRIREITRAVRLFYKAVMLIYKNSEGNRYEASFFIDEGISQSHGLAFLENEGLERLGLLKDININPKKLLNNQYSKFAIDNNQPINKKESRSGRKVLSLNSSTDSIAEHKSVRTLPVYEHPKILFNALESSKESLVIISPWISRAVVNHRFLRALEELLQTGVNVKIGYGIDDKIEKTEPTEALTNLSQKYNNLQFKELGDTHAKILIKDNDFYVITSFNWLSFKGDPKKKFREEWGNLVSDKSLVEEFRDEISERFI